MRQARGAAIKGWAAQKGAQHQDTSGRGCAWYAGPNHCYRGYPSGWFTSWRGRRGALIDGITAQHVIADKGYDSDAIIEKAEGQGMQAVIPPRKNRKVQRAYDKHLYRQRHLVENAFLQLKRWRGIATRYAKNLASFLAAVQIRCLVLWLNIS